PVKGRSVPGAIGLIERAEDGGNGRDARSAMQCLGGIGQYHPRGGPAPAAAGVNFADILMITGKYQERPMPPFTPGLEVAGRVSAVGDGVQRVKPGDRVLAMLDHGGFAEKVVARESDVFRIPDGMGF